MYNKHVIIVIFVLIYVCFQVCQCTHLQGTFKSNEFFKFLKKFGFQKTDRHQAETTHGYIFGNFTSRQQFHVPITFAVLDRAYFLEYYKNRVIPNKDEACKRMFTTLNTRAFDPKCSVKGKDYLRRIPCPKGKLCEDEDNPWNVVKNYQFTYVIQDFKQPSTNTLELYLLFWLCYMVLVPLQCHAVKTQKHPVTKLFTASLLLDFIALCLILIHTLKYALDGKGYPKLEMAGDIFDILSRTSFMLLLLLLAKGWAVTRLELTWKPLVFSIWLGYGVVHILLYVWNLTEVDIIEDIDEYQTWPGWLIIVFRSLIMIWFLYELRTTMLYEHNTQKLNFLLHFGASSLVWFIYLPILALIGLHVSALWRFKLFVGITYSADCFAYCVMAHLLWPTRSEQYFLLKGPSLADLEELDEFNEAPHIVNNSYTSLNSMSSVDICRYEDSSKSKLINT
ncbi:hypothetical protein NQ317_018068 [Molorchus minor]|uniref:GPR180/TMEM145 transmembrane domain-containing protein n=1 Tax=Molorchus minor TaxID=1323400 RepID=A0ABQ9JH26_9CUCU|nr:hypothetical protein NQ317_018068 [Molorchus minor]